MTHKESDLGLIGYSEMIDAFDEKKSAKKQFQFTEDKPFENADCAPVNGVANAIKRFKKTHPHLIFGESTAQNLIG